MTGTLHALLTGALPAGVYRLASRARAGTIARMAEEHGRRFFYLDGRQIATKSDFMQACAKAMQFPSYFGYNWDALEDSLRDLSWAPAQNGYLVLYDCAGHFAARREDFDTALDIFHSAVDYWRGTTTPMAVLLRGAGRAGAGLPWLVGRGHRGLLEIGMSGRS